MITWEPEKAEVQVWKIQLDLNPSTLARLQALLSKDELERASCFRFLDDYKKFIFNRGATRLILGQTLKLNPSELVFHYGKFGKPMLKHSTLQFNLSHSDSLALLAISLAAPVGIDIERNKKEEPSWDLVRSVLTEIEARRYQKLLPEERPNSFLKVFTRKEAYLKALGLGLSVSLRDFYSGFEPGELEICAPQEEKFCLHNLALGRDYIGALALRSKERFIVKDWTP